MFSRVAASPHRTFRGDFRHPALPGSDVIAYTRSLTSKASNGTRTSIEIPLISVLWAGADQVLHQRVFAPDMGWLDETPIAYLRTSGVVAGALGGTLFHDNDSGCDVKNIKKIVCQSGWYLDGIQFLYTDGSSTPWRGGSGGNRHEFELMDGGSTLSPLFINSHENRGGHLAGHRLAQQ
jgi:hypothetical protein